MIISDKPEAWRFQEVPTDLLGLLDQNLSGPDRAREPRSDSMDLPLPPISVGGPYEGVRLAAGRKQSTVRGRWVASSVLNGRLGLGADRDCHLG